MNLERWQKDKMSINKPIVKSIILISLFITNMGCASDKKGIEVAADKYCSLYEPSSWGELANSGSAYEIYSFIVIEQKKEIHNSAFKDIIDKADRTNLSTFYAGVRNGIENALGKKWDCEAFDEFYMPSRDVVAISLNEIKKIRMDPRNQSNIVIKISHAGDILIDNSPLVSNDDTVIKKAIELRVADKQYGDFQFVVYSDEGADGSLMTKILRCLSQLGVRNVSLLDY
jgi:biopolymer transport protein ExbD